MPTNFLRPLSDRQLINNDASCAPLTRQAMQTALNAAKDDTARIGRPTAVVPKMLVEIYPNALAAYGASNMEFHLPLSQRFASDKPRIDLTPYVLSLETTKNINAGMVGSCSITLKGSLLSQPRESSSSAVDPANQLDKSHTDWLQIIEDDDLIVVHLECGIANVQYAYTGDTQTIEFTTAVAGVTGSAAHDRYTIAQTGRNSAPMVFFGFVSSVRKQRAADGLGGATVTYTIEATDFSKAMSSQLSLFLLNPQSGILANRIGLPSDGALPVDVISAYLLRAVTNSRALNGDQIEADLVAAAMQPAAPNAPTSAPIAQSVLDEIAQKPQMLERINALTQALIESNRKVPPLPSASSAPSLFLMPPALTESKAAFDQTRIGAMAPVASFFASKGGAQLGELMTFHSGYSSIIKTIEDEIAVSYQDDKTANAPLCGAYAYPSFLTTLPSTMLTSIAADLNHGRSIEDVLSSVLGDTMGICDHHYDLCDYYGTSMAGDADAVTLPTMFVHSRGRPLTPSSAEEMAAYIGGVQDGKTPAELWALEHQLALEDWMSKPVNLLSETDIISETLQKDGTGRATLLHSTLNNQATPTTALAAGVARNDSVGTTTGRPLFYSKAAELAHGHRPVSYTSSNVVDETDLAQPSTEGVNVVFSRHRDDVLTQPYEIKGTIVVSMLMPSARVGQRLCVYRKGRAVESFDQFKARWDAGSTNGLHSMYLAAGRKQVATRIDELVRQQPSLYPSQIINTVNKEFRNNPFNIEEAQYRAWFFAHFDCFIIDEVSHGVDINPQDGTIQATTALVVSYGAIGREKPSALTAYPAATDLNEMRIETWAGSQPSFPPAEEMRLKSLPRADVVFSKPEQTPSAAELRATLESLNGLTLDGTSWLGRWQQQGEDAAMFRDIEAAALKMTAIERFIADMGTFYNINRSDKTFVRRASITGILNTIDRQARLDQQVSFPPMLRKPALMANIPASSALSSDTRPTSHWSRGQTEMRVPKGRIRADLLLNEINTMLTAAEADLLQALGSAEDLRATLVRQLSAK